MSKYKGLFTFDEDNHRYVPIAQADGIIDTMDYKPAEPLIKDEKIRKIVRAWAKLFDEISLRAVVNEDFISLFCDVEHYSASPEMDISPESFGGVISDHYYTIAELCGDEGQ